MWLRPGTSDELAASEAIGVGYHRPQWEPWYGQEVTVLDLGANIGLVAADYQRLWPNATIVMVEPNPDNLAVARRNAPEAIAIEAAVSVRSGRRRLQEDGLDAQSYHLTADSEYCEREVEAISIDDLLERFGPVEFCKMDVEGEEWKIIPHARWDDVGAILVEFHGPGDRADVLEAGLQLVEAAGFIACHHDIHPTAVWGIR